MQIKVKQNKIPIHVPNITQCGPKNGEKNMYILVDCCNSPNLAGEKLLKNCFSQEITAFKQEVQEMLGVVAKKRTTQKTDPTML